MLEQYKRTFFRIQLMIAFVTFAVHAGMGHHWPRTIMFFLIMQAGSLVGAAWGSRIRRLRHASQAFSLLQQ